MLGEAASGASSKLVSIVPAPSKGAQRTRRGLGVDSERPSKGNRELGTKRGPNGAVHTNTLLAVN